MTKEDARKELKILRTNIGDRRSLDLKIARHALDVAANYSDIFIYVSMGSEVSTRDIIYSLAHNKNVLVPYTDSCYVLHAVKLKSPLCEPNALGNTVTSCEYYDGQADIAFVPLLGFDSSLNRLGYGKGCYDRYFERHPNCIKAGLAYSQQFAQFDIDRFDIPLDMIITPDGIIRRTK